MNNHSHTNPPTTAPNPFGMLMPERVFTAGEYKFGFNGKENENEVEGSGNLQDYGMRTYDTRLSRFISPDPLRKKYPELSTYQFASNNPIQNIDLDGLEGCDNKFEYAYSSQFIGGSGMSAEDKGTYQGAFDSYIVPAAAGLFTFGTLGAAVAYPEIAGAMMGIETYAGGCLIGEEMSEGNITTPKMEPVTANEVKMTVTPDMTPGEKFEVRQNFAKSVMGSDYTKYNGSESVNYNNPVQNTQIGPGPGQPQLVQWREPGNTTASPFFTYDGVDPSTLGIPSTYTDKYYVTLDKSYNFLQSTAGTVEGWLPEDIGTLYEGGGTQLYSKEAAQSATLILSH